MFFGVGTLHPTVSLLWEVHNLPVVWLVRVRCTLFLALSAVKQGICIYDGRL